MRYKSLCMAGIGGIILICLMVYIMGPGNIHAADNSSGIVDGSPGYHSACSTPEDKKAGGYNDAVDYNDNTCNGQSSTWNFKNGYVFWSTKSKVAVNKQATLYRSIGWDITFSADLNGNREIDPQEQMSIEVARTIRGEYLSKMNYYYINYQQKETDGVLYNYSLYAMSYDRLQELATNHEAAIKNGKTPLTDAIFSADRIYIAIDAIMTTVDRDAKGNETINGYIQSENGTSTSGVSASATGNIKTAGTIYRCKNAEDYNCLVNQFNSASIATYKNSGAVRNNKLTLEYYLDVDTYGINASNGWSVNRSTGQIYYNGRPYTQTFSFWELGELTDFKDVICGDGYKLTGLWRCGESDCFIKDSEEYHTSYLARYASFSPTVSSIYNGNGTLKLYADKPASWSANGYTIEYYTRTKAASKTYSLIGTQSCEYGKSYHYYRAANTSAPVIKGVELLHWADGTGDDAKIIQCGSAFSGEDYPKAEKTNGYVVKLYAVWQVTPYTISCNENQPSGESVVHQIYEIYGIGFTIQKSLAETRTSFNPFYWTNSKYLIRASELDLGTPVYGKYIWNGYWDKAKQSQYFSANGKAIFSSAQTFEKNTTLYGSWKKNNSLTVMYKPGDAVTVSENNQGYGVDGNGFLTVKGKTLTAQYLATESVTLLEIPDCVKKDGCTKGKKWRISNSSESVAGAGTYSAKTLAKKAGGDLTKGNITVILEIPWSTFKYYVDYYFLNESNGSYEIKASQACMYGENYRFYSEQNAEGIKIPDGKVFKGWSKKTGSSSINYGAGEMFSNLCSKANGRISLYGVWGGITCYIDLNGNCPSDSEYPVTMGTTQISYVFGEQKECMIQAPSCPGYVFKGYFDLQKGGKQMIDSGGKSTAALSFSESGRTLYAQWEQKTYRMTFYANGGNFTTRSSGDGNVVSREGIKYGSYLPGVIAPAKEGYSFDGYGISKTEDGEVWYNRFLNSGSRRYNIAEDVSLFARWVDDIVPTGTIRASAGNSSRAWTNRNVRLSVTGSDAGSGVVKIQLFQKKYFENQYHLLEEWNTDPVRTYTGTVLVDTNGISNFYCVVYDARGNSNHRIYGTDSDIVSTVTTSVYVDKVAPRITVPVIEECRLGDETVWASLYASDDVIEE